MGAQRGVFAVPSVVCGGVDPRWGHEGPAAGEILRLGLRPAFSTHQVMAWYIGLTESREFAPKPRELAAAREWRGPASPGSADLWPLQDRGGFPLLSWSHALQPRELPSRTRARVPHLNSKSSRTDGKRGVGLLL